MSTSFAIAVPDEDIALLHKKLELMSLPDELEDANWDYGAPLADVRRLATYWKDGFDWRKAEAALNADLPMFKRDIDVEGHGALNVHYVHKESDVTNAIPLLFIHGWPGSFIEIRKLMPQLVTPPKDSPAFHVVCLGLPGYGFSEAPRKKGFGPIQCAEVGHKLMLALGYEEYVAQGGDWGSRISRVIAAKYPKHAKAWHTNMPLAEPPRLSRNPLSYLTYLVTPYTSAERKDLEAARELRATGLGYNILQATKPQTIGYNIMDSPVGLLAWIYEKLVGWTDDYPWSDDEVLTWISIYWFSRAGPAASVRIYYEDRLSRDEQAKLPVTVPTGFSHFAGEIIHFPKTWTRALGKVVQEVYHDKGGHFAAYEVPELLADDLRKMFGRAGPAYRVVKNCSGYAEEP